MSGYEVAAIITALGTFATTLTGLVISIQTRREVRTMNDLTMGQKSDADERRRILVIPSEERTRREQKHVYDTDEENGE